MRLDPIDKTSLRPGGVPLRWWVVFGLLAAQSVAASPSCQVDRFEGASLPQGVTTHMTVVNNAKACRVTTYGGNIDQQENPTYSGEITIAPEHGTARFEAPRAFYTPAADFAGEDRFSFEAFAKGQGGHQKHLRVRVEVTVLPP